MCRNDTEFVSAIEQHFSDLEVVSFDHDISSYDDNGNNVYDDGVMLYETRPCWIYAGCRATNEYSNTWLLFHCYDRHPNTSVASYLADYGYAPKLNVFRCSEITQWIFRSRIRKSLPIVLAITNEKMYNVFTNWLNNDKI